MRFRQYTKHTAWAILDKALPGVYGVGFIFVVVRVLPEKEFGLFLLFQAIFYFIQMADIALVHLPMTKFVAEGKAGEWAIPTAFLLSGTVLALAGLASLAAGPWLATLVHAPALADLLWLLPLMLAASFLKNFAGHIFIAHHRLRRLFALDATYFLGSLAVLLLFRATGLLHSARQVVLVNIFAGVAASAVAGIMAWQTLRSVHWSFARHRIRQLFAFGKYSFGAGVATYSYGQLDTFLIGYFYGPVQVAVYGAGKIIFRFYNIVSQAVQIVLLPAISRAHASEGPDALRAIVEKAICFLFIALLPLHLLLLAGAEGVLGFFYHGRYGGAAAILRWFVLGALVLPWGSVGSNFHLGVGRPRVNFHLALIVAVFLVVANLLLLPLVGVVGAAVTIALATTLGAVLQMARMSRAMNLTLGGIWRRRQEAMDLARLAWAKAKNSTISNSRETS